MVLEELGENLVQAIMRMNNATTVDKTVLKDCLSEISMSLLQADVRIDLVRELILNIKNILNFDELATGHDKRKIVEHVC